MGAQDGHEVPTEYQDSTQESAVDGAAERPPQRHKPGLDTDEQTPRDMETEEGNLLELPDGATFGTDEQPSAQERERLLRHAASAEQEMQDSAEEQDRPGR
ncbi:MAG: hypothetical protein ACR2FV_12145 [Ornithinimicrobium sp.]|uniref:hypothetical protein n=1 Tax=Ornithinimicrobium sp. TaxID=1977084 RepID=UPI003D9B0F57